MWIVAPVTILHQGQRSLDAGMGSQVQGVPVDDPMYRPMIVEGRWLQPGDDKVVVMNKETADDENIRSAKRLPSTWGNGERMTGRSSGCTRCLLVFGGGFSMDALYAPRPAVYEATKKTGKGSTLLVRTSAIPAKIIRQVASNSEDVFAQRHIEIFQIETMPALRKTSDAGFFIVVYMLLVLALIIVLVGGIGLMGSLWINVIERTKEIGILRAIGAVSSKIMGMFMLEGVLQGLMSWMIAIPISLAVTPMMANAMGQTMFESRLDYRVQLGGGLRLAGDHPGHLDPGVSPSRRNNADPDQRPPMSLYLTGNKSIHIDLDVLAVFVVDHVDDLAVHAFFAQDPGQLLQIVARPFQGRNGPRCADPNPSSQRGY